MSERLRALIVEDREDDELLLVRELTRGGYEVSHRRVETPEALEAALDDRWDIVFADYSMPRFTGLQALSIVRGRTTELPFMFVSGTIGEAVAVEAMKAGADDYFLKHDLHRLIPAVGRTLRDAEARRERSRLETEVRQAQRLESLGRLAGGIAHDFNNLLTAILGHADFLLNDPELGSQQRHDVGQILGAGERARRLTNQLLAFSRRQVLSLGSVDLNRVVADLTPMLGRLLGEPVHVTTRLAEGLGSVRADVGQMEQVIMNLAVNARDAMPGGGRLTIETSEVRLEGDPHDDTALPAGDYVRLRVVDTGVGMDEETMAHLFEPFYTTKPEGEGTGLGLATVYGIVKQSGGDIQVESAPGEGSRFDLFLPREVAPAARPTTPESRRTASGGTETVLVVEDEEAVRKLVSRALERRGYRVVAVDGAEAADRVLDDPDVSIDLLLTDAVLPDRSGKSIADAARARRPGLPVLYMSGYAATTLGQRGELDVGDTLLHKPFTASELAEAVRGALDPPA